METECSNAADYVEDDPIYNRIENGDHPNSSSTLEYTYFINENDNNSENGNFLRHILLTPTPENTVPTMGILRDSFFEVLKSASQFLYGESQFYLAQDYLKMTPAIEQFAPRLEFLFSSILKNDAEHDKLQETVFVLHSIYSLLHNIKFPGKNTECTDKLMDVLMLNLVDPRSRCGSSSHCFLLKDIIADIIVVLFEKCYSKEVWERNAGKLVHAFSNSSLGPQYGVLALLLSMNNQNIVKELLPSLESCGYFTFYRALNYFPSRQLALNVRNKLLLVFQYWIKHCLDSKSLDLSVNMKFISSPDPRIVDSFHFFCRAELIKYYICPAKYMVHRMPPKTSISKPVLPVSYWMTPTKKKIDSIFKSKLINPSSSESKILPGIFDDDDELGESLLSPWSKKTTIKLPRLPLCDPPLQKYMHTDFNKNRNVPFVETVDKEKKEKFSVKFKPGFFMQEITLTPESEVGNLSRKSHILQLKKYNY